MSRPVITGDLYQDLDAIERRIEHLERFGPPAASSSVPGGAAGGVLAGTYPNPGFAFDMATQAELNAAIAALNIGQYAIKGNIVVADLAFDPATQAELDAAVASIMGDSRWTNARIPTGPAGGDLTGNYPNPGVNAQRIKDVIAALASGDKIAWETASGDFVEIWGEQVPTGTWQTLLTDTFETDPFVGGRFTKVGSSSYFYDGTNKRIYSSVGGQGLASFLRDEVSTPVADCRVTVRMVDIAGENAAALLTLNDQNSVGYEAWPFNANLFQQFTIRLGGTVFTRVVTTTEPRIADPWIRFTKSGNTLTGEIFNGDPAAGGALTYTHSYGLVGSEATTLGAGVALRGAITGGYSGVADTLRWIDNYRIEQLLSSPSADLYLAVTPPGGVRTVKRIYGASGAALRSDFLLKSDAAGGDLGGTYPNPTVTKAQAGFNVGGVAVVLTNDARLSDQRVPVDGSVTPAKLSFDPATQAELDAHIAAPDPHPGYALDSDLNLYVPKSLIDAKGDLLAGTADNTLARVAATGVAGNVLTEDPTTASGWKSAAPPAGGGGTYVTVLPGAPTDGQEVFFAADAANGVIWHLRYRAGSVSAYKWEFLGGPPLVSTIDTDESTAAVILQDLTTVGPSVTVPLAGDYVMEIGANMYTSSTTGACAMNYAVGGAAPVSADAAQAAPGTTSTGHSSSSVRRKNGIAAATAITAKYAAVTDGTANFRFRVMQVRPIRVG